MDFEELMKKRLKNFKEHEGCVSGYVEEGSYEALLNELCASGYSYSVRKSKKHNASERLLSYSAAGTAYIPEISCSGCPFQRLKTIRLECSLGPKYYKKQIDKSDHTSVKKRRFRIRSSKKLNCPAWLMVQSVKVFTEYNAEDPSWKSKTFVSDMLKAALQSSSPPPGETRYYMKGNIEHNHSKTEVDLNQTIHPELSKEIRRLVRTGITSTKLIKNHLETYVNNIIDGENLPSLENKAFYPPHSVIYTHIYRELSLLALSEVNPRDNEAFNLPLGEPESEEVEVEEEVFAPNKVATIAQEMREEAKLWADMSYRFNDASLVPAFESALDELRSKRLEMMKLLSCNSKPLLSSRNKYKASRRSKKARIAQ